MNKKAKTDQRGVVSLLVTMIMMLVISLIVIGFSQVARRNQRETLDRQLSTQAYYAAESGINVARNYIQQPGHVSTAIDTLSSGNCNASFGSGSPVTPSSPVVLDSTTSTSVSCLMINTTPSQLVANPVTQDGSIVFHVKNQNTDASTNTFKNLVFTWEQPQNNSDPTTCTSSGAGPLTEFPAYSNWNCNYGILRVDFVAVPAGGFSQATLSNPMNVKTVYFVPSANKADSVSDLSAAKNAYVQRSKCSGTSGVDPCTATVTGLISSEYYVRINTIYRDSSSVTMAASDGTPGSQVGGVKFVAGQAVIDSTGKAQDELRRIQVRVPLVSSQTALPLFGVQSSGSLCKKLNVSITQYSDGCISEPGILN